MPNPAWTPATAASVDRTVIIDPHGNVQQCARTGTTGSALPQFATALGAVTNDNSTAWVCLALLQAGALPGETVGLAPPVFVTDAAGLDPAAIIDDMIASFEHVTGRNLYPAQIERLLINLYAYRESLVRNLIQYAGQQCLVAFANYPNLDYLGELVGTRRLEAGGALTTLEFTLTAALDQPYIIQAGTLAGSSDGTVQFATTQAVRIPAGQTVGSAGAVCTTAGTLGNGYAAGKINVQLRPDALVKSVSNTTETANGAEIESTDALRERIRTAPNRFSTAGPGAAYRFFAMSVDPTIVDVQVLGHHEWDSVPPGTVAVRVLAGPITMQPHTSPNTQGAASPTLIDAVEAALSSLTVRPMNDTLDVDAVTEVNYEVVGTIVLQRNVDPPAITQALITAAVGFALRVASRIQVDVVPEEWTAVLGSIGGVYRVQLGDPVYRVLLPGEWANCTAITLALEDLDGNPLGSINLS
jgi:phage-related baseplate assembly protein